MKRTLASALRELVLITTGDAEACKPWRLVAMLFWLGTLQGSKHVPGHVRGSLGTVFGAFIHICRCTHTHIRPSTDSTSLLLASQPHTSQSCFSVVLGATFTSRATTAAIHASGRVRLMVCSERREEARQEVGRLRRLASTALHAASCHSVPVTRSVMDKQIV